MDMNEIDTVGKVLEDERAQVSSRAFRVDNRMTIAFSDIVCSVSIKGPSKRGSTEQRKSILKGVSGILAPGRLMALMGSSGAGKTTLLDVLAGNSINGVKVMGSVEVNGAPRRLAEFRQKSCYVMQSDVLLSSATVRESIMTSAFLKLPQSMSTPVSYTHLTLPTIYSV